MTRRNNPTRLLPILAAFALAGCAPTATINRAAEEAAIRAAEQEYMAAFNAHDVNRLLAVHSPDAVVMVSNTPLASGTSALNTAFAEFFREGSPRLSFTPTRIDIVSPTVATEYGTYTNTFNTPQGMVTDRGNYTTVWHKINGQWRIAIDAPVTAMPMPGSTAMAPPMPMGDVATVMNSSLTWQDFNPPGFNPGMKLAVINGDPGKPGPYTVRLQFPAGYRFPVHWHPGIENLTVVSGPFQLAMGNTADWSALKTYAPGDYIYIPPRHAHFGGSASTGSSVIQLHGIGPFQVMLGPPTS